jgi:FdhD protein
MDCMEFKYIASHEGNEQKLFVQELIPKEPLSIQVGNVPYMVVMRTPGKEIFHAAGFCLAEGLVDNLDDFLAIANCPDLDPNMISVSLAPERRKKVAEILKRRDFMSQRNINENEAPCSIN